MYVVVSPTLPSHTLEQIIHTGHENGFVGFDLALLPLDGSEAAATEPVPLYVSETKGSSNMFESGQRGMYSVTQNRDGGTVRIHPMRPQFALNSSGVSIGFEGKLLSPTTRCQDQKGDTTICLRDPDASISKWIDTARRAVASGADKEAARTLDELEAAYDFRGAHLEADRLNNRRRDMKHAVVTADDDIPALLVYRLAHDLRYSLPTGSHETSDDYRQAQRKTNADTTPLFERIVFQYTK